MQAWARRSSRVSILVLFLTGVVAPGPPSSAADAAGVPTVARLLERHRAASGADDALASIATLSMRGIAEAGAMRFSIHERRKRPGKIRMEFVMNGQTIVQASDGEDAWWLDPVMGSGKVEAMPDAYGRNFRRTAHLDDFYLAADQAQVSFALVGSEQDDAGRTLHEVRVTGADGSAHSRYFDEATGLYVRKRSSGPTGEMVADFSDFREVGGVLMPFRVELSLGQRFVYEEAKVNEPMADDLFTRPQG